MPKLPKKLPAVSINLIPQDAFMESIVGKFLVWSLSIGRYIVILTEFVVIMSFLSRFKLDRDLTDVNEAIERQKNVILSYGSLETDFTKVQSRINFIKQKQTNNTIIQTLTFLEQNIPVDVKLTQVSIQPLSWTIDGSALSAEGMKMTVDQIVQANPKSNVSLSQVKLNSQTRTADFNIKMEYQTTANQASTKKQNTSEETDTSL